MKNKKIEENGITLIALIITVIILLILAGVAISSLGNSGLFSKSKDAVNKYADAQKNEESELANYLNELEENELPENLDVVVVIPDVNLRGVIKTNLSLTEDNEITKRSMLGLIDLNGNNKSIVNLEGIEFAKNLTSLSLTFNQIVDISLLSKLNKLEILMIYNNKISDITALKDLKSLTNLYLSTNQISDISALSNLIKLDVLDLAKNQITDINVLKNLINITSLGMQNNQITDISILSNLNKLNLLHIQNNQISNFTPIIHLKDMPGITVDISNNLGTWPA